MIRRTVVIMSALAVAALTLTGCAQPVDPVDPGSDAPTSTEQIVIDTTFDIATIDPGREYEPTGQIVVKALYDTLLTFADNDTTTVIPDLAEYTANDDLTEFVFTLVGDRVFSDGTAVTADDVVFSLNRLIGMKGNPSFLLDGVTITKTDDVTITMTTEESNPALPAVLATPSAGILNSKVVIDNGGTTDESDGAETYLNSNSAGSGPYVLEMMDVATQAILVKNENYNGSQKPTYEKVILRNVEPATQKMNVERGDAQVAMGLSGDQVDALDSSVSVSSTPSATVVFLLMNSNPKVNEFTAKPKCVEAVKAALNYESILELAGRGASQATGVVPAGFLGALPQSEAPKYDLEAAKVAATECGMTESTITLSLPNDIDPAGTSLTTVAQRIQQQLAEAGITVELAPAPFATEIDAYRTGKEQIGLWYWNPDYMDPANYLAFGPGQTVGLRAGWTAEMNPAAAELVAKAYTTGDLNDRKTLFQDWGRLMNAESPFIPLIQPGSNVAHQPSVTNVYYNPTWLINVAGLGAA
ncbi:MAG: ABC transporter substrate-binding protein [Propionibacteriaceae bacterium]|jgi:peptide/nickel transport system substrate-binding protein|nr:ABC transporter substrate-binding protein [Propionibacteriaceae bacterium]